MPPRPSRFRPSPARWRLTASPPHQAPPFRRSQYQGIRKEQEPVQESTATPSLNGWVTMSNVSDALGIKLDTVRQTVHRALLDGQEWVKRAPYPAPNNPVRWLINTNHAIYQYHERRWRKLAEKTSQEMASGNGHSGR